MHIRERETKRERERIKEKSFYYKSFFPKPIECSRGPLLTVILTGVEVNLNSTASGLSLLKGELIGVLFAEFISFFLPL